MSDKIKDFVQAAMENQPVDAADSFDAGIRERITDILADKKVEIAQSMFNKEEETDE